MDSSAGCLLVDAQTPTTANTNLGDSREKLMKYKGKFMAETTLDENAQAGQSNSKPFNSTWPSKIRAFVL